MKVVVFDLGGTLMQYVGMPYSWVDYYRCGLRAVADEFGCSVSRDALASADQMLRDLNPRVNPRVVEYPAEQMFAEVLQNWHIDAPVNRCIEVFWRGLQLNAEIFPDTMQALPQLKERGFQIAALTDLPSGMPDAIFKQDIPTLLEHIDFYVSSEIAGYRKPDPAGLRMIAARFSIPMEDLVFVGDEEKDRQTAMNAGCRFVQIRRNGSTGAGIPDLCELLDIL